MLLTLNKYQIFQNGGHSGLFHFSLKYIFSRHYEFYNFQTNSKCLDHIENVCKTIDDRPKVQRVVKWPWVLCMSYQGWLKMLGYLIIQNQRFDYIFDNF